MRVTIARVSVKQGTARAVLAREAMLGREAHRSKNKLRSIACVASSALLLTSCVPSWSIRDAFYEEQMAKYNNLLSNKALAFSHYYGSRGGYVIMNMSGDQSTIEAARNAAVSGCISQIEAGASIGIPCHIVIENDTVIEDISDYTTSARKEAQANVDGAIGLFTRPRLQLLPWLPPSQDSPRPLTRQRHIAREATHPSRPAA